MGDANPKIGFMMRIDGKQLQPIDGLSYPNNFLKAPQSGTFKKLFGLYSSAKRCNWLAGSGFPCIN